MTAKGTSGVLLGLVLAAFSSAAWAQVRVRGQIFLPSGQAIGTVTEFQLESDDPRRQPDTMWTDVQGRFLLQGLQEGETYRIVVRSDGQRYATTVQNFIPISQPWVAVHLLPLAETTKTETKATISVDELGGSAREAYAKATKAIQQKNPNEAKKQLKRVIELDPRYVRAYNDLAVLHMADRQYAEAEKLLRAALEKDADAIHPLYNLGVSLNHLGRHAEAVTPLRAALKAQPKWRNAEAQLGIALLQTGELEAARPCLERGTQAEGIDQVYSYLYAGKLYADKGELGYAIAAWNKYLELDPKSANADQVRGLLQQMRLQAKPASGPLATAKADCQ